MRLGETQFRVGEYRFRKKILEETHPTLDSIYKCSTLQIFLSGITLWMLQSLIWNRFIDTAVQNFVDLCSLCNVSVVIMTHEQFGYYIHGRTVHGHGDMNLKEMHQCLKREEVFSLLTVI